MMANYVSNTQISGPNMVPDLNPDVDLGGLKFSYKYGIFYSPVIQDLPITPASPFPT
jgi:hypothetical protein